MRQRLQKAMLVMVLCLLAVTTALAQAIQVKGIVYDGNGENDAWCKRTCKRCCQWYHN